MRVFPALEWLEDDIIFVYIYLIYIPLTLRCIQAGFFTDRASLHGIFLVSHYCLVVCIPWTIDVKLHGRCRGT